MLSTGSLSSFAGNGISGFDGDGGPRLDAKLNFTMNIAISPNDSAVFFCDWGNNRVRMVSLQSGIISTLAGNGTAGYSGDNGPASMAMLNLPMGLALFTDDGGTLQVYVADSYNGVIRVIDTVTLIINLATSSPIGYESTFFPISLAIQETSIPINSCNLFIADSINGRVWLWPCSGSAAITTYAGGAMSSSFGDNGPATSAYLGAPSSILLDIQGNLFIADSMPASEQYAYATIVRRVDHSTQVITTVAGVTMDPSNTNGDGALATSAYLRAPAFSPALAIGTIFNDDSKFQPFVILTLIRRCKRCA